MPGNSRNGACRTDYRAISTGENRTLLDWLSNGAPSAAMKPLNASLTQEVEYWESLFNGESLKHQLAARYLYEHLFLAHLYLEDAGANTVFFKLVRSRTPPGQPLDIIATRRPYDDPGVSACTTGLWRDPASVVAKTHMPYRLSPARRDKWKYGLSTPTTRYATARLRRENGVESLCHLRPSSPTPRGTASCWTKRSSR